MNEDQIRSIVQNELKKGQYGVAKTPYHRHTGVDSPQIEAKSIIGGGFPTTPMLGDMVYYDGTAWVSLPIGPAGYVITSSGTSPTYTITPNLADTIAVAGINSSGFSAATLATVTYTKVMTLPHTTPDFNGSGGVSFDGNSNMILPTTGVYLITAAISYGHGTATPSFQTTISGADYGCIIASKSAGRDPGSADIIAENYLQSSVTGGRLTPTLSIIVTLGSGDAVSLLAWQNSGQDQALTLSTPTSSNATNGGVVNLSGGVGHVSAYFSVTLLSTAII